MDNYLSDNSFIASLQFCPSIVKRSEEVTAIFSSDRNTIVDDNNFDGETFNAEWNRKEVDGTRKMITNDDLKSFDNELRRAEC